MRISRRKEYSPALGRDMEYNIYGFAGKPMLVFPTSRAHFEQYEEFGMIETLASRIDAGKIQVWTCDGIDEETFHSKKKNFAQRIRRHEQYDAYIIRELVPSILLKSRQANETVDEKLLVTGCSMGAYHSANFFFRHPEVCDTLIGLSGLYSAGYFFGDYMDKEVYLNSPLHYLPNLKDEYYLSRYRQSRIIFCCGRGAWEEEAVLDMTNMQKILRDKNVPAWIDFWGPDVEHHWYWWKKQIVYFLDHCLNPPAH